MSKQIIKLGMWDGKPIEWIVLKEDGFKALVISKYPLFSCRYNDNKSNGNQWGKSSLRNFLNGAFWSQAFTLKEKKCVVNCQIKSPGVTKDNVFVLSKEEAETLLKHEERIIGDGRCHNGCSSCFQRYCNEGAGTCWWLRSPFNGDCAFNASCDGDISYSYVDYPFTVRPAMYIKWKKINVG